MAESTFLHFGSGGTFSPGLSKKIRGMTKGRRRANGTGEFSHGWLNRRQLALVQTERSHTPEGAQFDPSPHLRPPSPIQTHTKM